jgi:hypothetical protein
LYLLQKQLYKTVYNLPVPLSHHFKRTSMYDENSNSTTAAAATIAALNAAAAATSSNNSTAATVASINLQHQQQQQQNPATAGINSTQLVSQLMNTKDSRWLQLEVCREFQRGQCTRSDIECKFAHPPAHVDVQNGRVTACYDSIKGRCTRENPKCKYLHPPQHLKDQLLINGKNTLVFKNIICNQLQNGGAALAPALQVNNSLAQLMQQQQHPALVQALPYQYYSPLMYSPLLAAQGDPYSVQTANGGPIPMKRPAPDKNAAAAAAAAAGLPLYPQQLAAAAAAGQFNPYLIPGYMPAVSCQYFL